MEMNIMKLLYWKVFYVLIGNNSLFELAIELYNQNIYAYYFDMSFEETLKRHQTRACRDEFGEKEMKSWWREKDFALY